MSYLKVLAAEPKVKDINKPVSTLTKKLLIDEKKSKTLENVTDDAEIFWVDVKKTFPDLEQQIKPLFAGKDRISVKDLKEKLAKNVTDEDASYWLSQAPYNSGWRIQTELEQHGAKQVAIQLNIGPELVKAIDANPVAQRFFSLFADKVIRNHLHPNHSQTIAWARVYKFEDKWIIEELQSDIWGGSLKTNEKYNREKGVTIPLGVKVLDELGETDKKELEKFFYKHFLDWDKKLIATVIRMARKEGVHHIYMWDSTIKEKATSSKSKLERLYRIVPRDLGFKLTQLEVDGKDYPAWHRVVANSFLQKLR